MKQILRRKMQRSWLAVGSLGARAQAGCRILAVGVMLFANGCGPDPAIQVRQLDAARSEYERRDFNSAQNKLDAYLLQNPNAPDSAQAYYLRALCHAALANRTRAEADARKCIELTSDTRLRAKAHATAASVLLEGNQTVEAMPHFVQALKVLPEEPPKDLLHYRYGQCLQQEGRWREAKLEFATVFQRYPRSSVAALAKRHYEWPNAFYSIQCGAFRDQRSADALAGKLKTAGLSSRVDSLPRSGELLHMVYVGQYPQYRQARSALPAVQRQVRDALIVPQ